MPYIVHFLESTVVAPWGHDASPFFSGLRPLVIKTDSSLIPSQAGQIRIEPAASSSLSTLGGTIGFGGGFGSTAYCGGCRLCWPQGEFP